MPMHDSTSSPDSPRRFSFDFAAWRPVQRTWLWVLLAFAGGLLLFALVLSGARDGQGNRADRAPPTASGPNYAPLPAPLSAGADRNASGLGEARQTGPAAAGDDAERPQLVETRPPPPPEPAIAPAASSAPAAVAAQPVPIPGRMPAPRYPTQALRRGESGTVLVQAEIGADGVPTSVSVASSSGSRSLDRAAVDAVRRWRFRPAELDGQPTGGTVRVPIEFNHR